MRFYVMYRGEWRQTDGISMSPFRYEGKQQKQQVRDVVGDDELAASLYGDDMSWEFQRWDGGSYAKCLVIGEAKSIQKMQARAKDIKRGASPIPVHSDELSDSEYRRDGVQRGHGLDYAR